MVRGRSEGFTLIEVVVATSLLLVLLALAMGQLSPAERVFDRQTEAADMQQRSRAALTALQRDLADAGASAAVRADAGALTMLAPAIWPMRLGLRGPDPAGTFRDDVVTVLGASPWPAVQTAIVQPTAALSGNTRVASTPGCPPLDPACGLTEGSDLLIADGEGAFDLYTVSAVAPPTLDVTHNTPDWSHVYAPGSALVPITVRTYALRTALGPRPPQLVRYEGGRGPDAPVVDHVVGLHFEYFGDPAPPRMRRPLSDVTGPWTTYGPPPPVADASAAPWTAGANCLFADNGSALATPRLSVLGSPGSALVPLTAEQLTDGPWCPHSAAPNRYDADLYRIRSIGITIRVESAIEALRGPAGLLFARPGTASGADRYAPDLEVRLRVTPPNLVLDR